MIDYTLPQWQAGERRLRESEPDGRRALDRVVERLVAELRHRLGGAFSSGELAELYDGSYRWTMQIAIEAAPSEPVAWEQWVADAAFARYVREATDWPLRR
ncbi:MAG TPA: hypothetical protein VHX66_04160 [Solirubrobacteraceae bacterium]|jgi:hypothetical protein|nr:hypothetical protein [Solirubrobacteraceae bacterium]